MITKLINIASNVEWRVLLPSVSIAVAIPELYLFIRFLIPIISGIVWVYLKPYIIKFRDRNKAKSK